MNQLTPQVELKPEELMPTNTWYHFKKSFFAQGNERFVTIGNFRLDEEVNFIIDSIDCVGLEVDPILWFEVDVFYIDDIAVFPASAFRDSARVGNDTTICIGESITLGTHNIPEYTYTYTDENSNEYPGAYLEFIPNQTSTFILTVKDNYYIETHDTITVYTNDCQNYNATAPADATICLGDSIVLEDEYIANFQYQWTNEFGGEWFGSTVVVHPTQSREYYLQITDNIGITYDTLFLTVQDCEADLHEFRASKIKLHPNPASSFVQIESPYPVSSWSLVNTLGQVLKTSTTISETRFVLNITDFEAGLYYVTLQIEERWFVKVLIVD